MAKTYEQYYNQYMKGLDTTAYDDLAKSYAESVDADSAKQIADANKSAQGQLKQAYITRVQDQRKLNDNLAASGIRGGATETSNLKLATNYGNTRNTINTSLAQSIDSINRTAQQSKLAYQQDIDAKKRAYIENREQEARQAAREGAENDYQKAQTKRTQKIEEYTAKYSKYFDTKQLKKLLRKAKNPLQKQVINARIGYLKSPEYKAAKKSAK